MATTKKKRKPRTWQRILRGKTPSEIVTQLNELFDNSVFTFYFEKRKKC